MRKLVIFMLFLLIPGNNYANESSRVLTLNEAINMALQNNPTLQVSDAAVDIMKAKVQNAKSNLYPHLEFRFIIPFVERESQISLDQLIWDFWQTPNLIKATKAQLESAEIEKSITKEDLILETKIAYYTTLAQEHVLKATKKILALNEKRLEQIENLFNLGRRSRLDVTKAKVEVGNVKLSLITAENNLEIAKNRLSTLLGIERDFNYELQDMLEYKIVNLDLDQAIEKALRLRPELKNLMVKETGIEYNIKALKNKLYYPQIFGRAAYRFEGEGATGPDFIAGIGIRFPIFKGFSDLASVSEAQAKLRQLEANIKSTREQIKAEVKELYLNLKLAEERLRVTELSKQSAEENFLLAQEEYRLGKSSIVDFMESEALLAETTANYYKSIYDYKIAIAQLERAIGEKIEQ